MAITGVHALLYSPQAEELRATLRDVLGWDNVDSGGGWLIFALPPAEMGVHPADKPHHEITLMCDGLDETVAELEEKGIEFDGEPRNEGFGRFITMILPGGVKVMLYEPQHPTAV